MTKVKLISHSFPDDPSWIVVNESVPLGTEYELLDFGPSEALIVDYETGKSKLVDLYLLRGHNSIGYMPISLFKVIES